jgi:cation-transporting ATPase E
MFTVPLGILNLLKFIFFVENPINYTANILSPIIDMIPCGMLLLTSIALSTGIIKLSRKNTLVQDLYSIEMLARVDTLCFDKTGTITDGSMSVESMLKLNSEIDIEAALNSYIAFTGANTPTSKAIISHFNQSSLNEEVINSIPFSSAKKYDAVEFEKSGTFILGAPEFIEAACKRTIITEDIASFIKRENNLAHRTLMLAHTFEHIKDDALFKKAEPIAIISLKDNVRKNVKETLDWFYDNGVDIKIISGDNLTTVQKISELAGVRNFESAVSLDGMSDG